MNCKCIVIITTAIVVIIGVIVLVLYKVKLESSENIISLEVYAFDDQYEGCEKDMEIKAEKLLAKERESNSYFNEVWKEAESQWKNIMGKDKKLFEVAVIAYTLEDPKIYAPFNHKVSTCCKSLEDYMCNFHFKALHFYLTRAVQILRRSCRNVYRGVSVGQLPDGTGQMRFGQFASTSLSESTARNFAKQSGTLYKVYTCEGAKIEKFSAIQEEREVLIPPYEVFSVSTFSDSGTLKIVELHSTGKRSKFNCAYVKGKNTYNCTNSAPGNILAWPGHLTPLPLFGLLFLLLQG